MQKKSILLFLILIKPTTSDFLLQKLKNQKIFINSKPNPLIKLLHDAVWYLVSYDTDSLYAGIQLPQDYKSVIARGMSVCAGFSEVFHQFCSVAGIAELPLGGYARGIGFLGQKWSEKDDPIQSNHAWNIVKVGQYWYLIDVTWDSGSTSKGKRDDYYTELRMLFIRNVKSLQLKLAFFVSTLLT